jgi:hypothetical protein
VIKFYQFHQKNNLKNKKKIKMIIHLFILYTVITVSVCLKCVDENEVSNDEMDQKALEFMTVLHDTIQEEHLDTKDVNKLLHNLENIEKAYQPNNIDFESLKNANELISAFTADDNIGNISTF